MQTEIVDRILEEAQYIINTGATVRKAAAVFGQSKSTVHKDVTDRLVKIDYDLFLRVRKVLNLNLKERHVRGGEATKLKYALEKQRKISN